MSFVSGHQGKVVWAGVFGTTNVVEIRRWADDITADVLDGTTMTNTDGWRKKKVGLLGGAGTIECLLDPETEFPIVGGTLRDPVDIELHTDVDDGGYKYTGSAILTGVHPDSPHDGVPTITLDFEFNDQVDVETLT